MLNFQDQMAPVTGSQNMRVPPLYFSAGGVFLCTNHNYRMLGHTVGCKGCSRRIFRTVSHDAPHCSLLLLTLLILLTTRLLQKILNTTWSLPGSKFPFSSPLEVSVSIWQMVSGSKLAVFDETLVPDLDDTVESDYLTKKCLAWCRWDMIIRVARIRTSMLTMALVKLLWPVPAFSFSFGFFWNVNMLQDIKQACLQ